MGQGNNLLEFLYLLIGGSIILFVSVLSGLYALATSRKRMVKVEIEKRNILLEKKQNILEATIEGAEEERRKMAEELHDQINAQLTLVRMGISGHGRQSNNQDQLDMLDKTIQQLREISRELLPPVLERFGLIEALNDLFNRVEGQCDIVVDFEGPDHWPEKIMKRDLAIFRIAQEFIQNTVKYARANHIEVKLDLTDEGMELILADNGVGFDTNNVREGLGMRNIHSRIEYLNGSIRWDSAPDKGVCLAITIPLKQNTDAA